MASRNPFSKVITPAKQAPLAAPAPPHSTPGGPPEKENLAVTQEEEAAHVLDHDIKTPGRVACSPSSTSDDLRLELHKLSREYTATRRELKVRR